jgi:2'-hydroxyisoflavone reductase
MRLLVLGGSVFLSREVAAEAVRRGHDVTCACRGSSGALPDGVRHVVWDRADAVPAELARSSYDGVVDVARRPSWVRRAVEALPDAHWVFVSSVSAYADDATPGGGPGTLPLHPAREEDADLAVEPQAYGPMKVACEQVVTGGAASSVVVRPGLVVGPGDPTGRFTYWPARLAAAGTTEVVAPGSPSDAVQVVDVRDLAGWLVSLAESRTTGVLDGVGPVQPLGDLLDAVATGVGADPAWTWLPSDFLEQQRVDPWSGPRSLPLWLPRPAYDGMLAHDPEPARAAGLVTRPVADTAADTLSWLRSEPEATVTGLTADEESELLASWHAR